MYRFQCYCLIEKQCFSSISVTTHLGTSSCADADSADLEWCLRSYVFFLKFTYFNWSIITLQYCDGFCHTSIWICLPESPSHRPPPPAYPSRLLQSTSFVLLHAANLLWLSALRMAVYMFQCYSLKSSRPLLLPLSAKVCSCRLCLLCCLYVGSPCHLSRFHIYALIYNIWLSCLILMCSQLLPVLLAHRQHLRICSC